MDQELTGSGMSGTLQEIETTIGRLSPVQKILLGTDGSVTQMLEIITGTPVALHTLHQEVVSADHTIAQRLDIPPGEAVNHRIVELKNAHTGEVLVYAISDTPLSRLAARFREDLMRADIPIGKIMKKHQIESRREIAHAGAFCADAELSSIFAIFPGEILLRRNYNIIHNRRPLIAIEEVFPYNQFIDERKVIVEAPSRIHLGLIDMNGGLGRVDGGIGIALHDPAILCEGMRSDEVKVSGEDAESVEIIRRTAEHVIAEMGFGGGVEIALRTAYPRHIGLGSGTALALSTARIICELFGRQLGTRDLARMVGRGGTSGIGTAAFEHGGFIVDGGRNFGYNLEKSEFRPSSASKGLKPPHITMHQPFPEDWKILLATPLASRGSSGSNEQDIFRRYCPVPLEEVRALCHELVVRMLPGIVEHDLDLFGSSINHFQSLGFKKVEMNLQPPMIPRLLEELRTAGAAAAGMSSFGPTVFAIADTDMRQIESTARVFMDEHGGGDTLITSARNGGASVRNC
jgi:beta-ribofuranosylaminobenzene 5'-phosphate synthase